MFAHVNIYSLSKLICNSCNETVDVNAVFIREAYIQATLTSTVVSMGNFKHSGKLLRIMQCKSTVGRNEIIYSCEYSVTIGGITNNRLRSYNSKNN